MPTVTLEEVFKKSYDEQTAKQILDGLEFTSTGGFRGKELEEIAGKLHGLLKVRLEQTVDTDEQLVIARAARATWEKECADYGKRYHAFAEATWDGRGLPPPMPRGWKETIV